ncbi:ABC transporter substrate-binding protein [Desulfobacula toluolica]|uniref:Predicted iron ABC transporter, substrate-binding protein n=1 Tax=Desulfobacula toluolica (strain DSM 7467 / Tol2) TaxID=651182 RepID=K0N4T4_DESTT|nr:ABC transporter substrate-binding protein [Desulfobacula toluolica]CCK79119.1 predicted iron ABC transporter, substrate-binding protein, precursor [Desulfobacula toluolica Tol2]
MRHKKTIDQRGFVSCITLSGIILSGVVLLLIPGILGATQIKSRIITDMAGRTVLIKDPVEKIVTTFKPASLCMLSLGLAHKLVGIDTHSKQDRLQLSVFPDVAMLTGVGSKTMGINFETLVSLKPDLVILYSQKDGLALADRLIALGISSIVIMPETFDSIKKSLRVIALAAGELKKSRIIERQMDKTLDLLSQRLAGVPQNLKKTGYFASSKGIFSTTTGNMLQNEIFNAAGVENVSSHLTGYFQNISPEQLVKWNPDIIVLSQHMKKSENQRIFDKALQKVTAISQKNVYRCPSSIAPWDFPSPLSVLASLWIAQKIYPERFSDLEIEKKADEFHQAVFGKTLTQMGGTLSDTVNNETDYHVTDHNDTDN